MYNEQDVVKYILLGDIEQFEQIVLTYQNLVFTVCYNIVRNEQDAENMAQETFLTAFRSLSSFRGSCLKSWLCRIATNKCIDFKRRHTRAALGDLLECENMSDGMSVEENLLRQERLELLDEALGGIGEKYSEVLRAFFFDDLSVKQIAARMELPEKTVETRLYRAKKLIRERWRDYE